MRRLVRFVVVEPYLRLAMALPEDVRVVAIGGDAVDQAAGRFVFVVEGSEFPEMAEGEEIPVVTPVFWFEDGQVKLMSWGGL